VFFAPGRVNLVGAHLDYNGGPVLPVAVDRGVYVAARLRDDSSVALRSLDVEPPLDIELAELGTSRDAAHEWASYPLGVLRFFAEKTGISSGVEMVFTGDLPIASGLSSSAAMEIATAFALNELHGAGLAPDDLAMIGFRAETEYVGLKCGIMDQFASAVSRPGHVLLLDCSNATYEHVPLDGDAVEILVMDTGVPRALGETNFNRRVEECQEAYRLLRELKERKCLAHFKPDDLELAGDRLNGSQRKRAEHVVTEVTRVASAVASLRSGDIAALGRELNASHQSTRDLYEVSSLELDVITDAARELDDVYGARLTGAGFGGCAIALIRPGTSEHVQSHVRQRYTEKFGKAPGFHLLRDGPGPCEIV